ncbi:5'-AMP-activated protein kinase beta-2 subunit protein, partial [Striga asiatica]
MDHIFFRCKRAHVCWKLVGISWHEIETTSSTFQDWWLEITCVPKDKVIEDRINLLILPSLVALKNYDQLGEWYNVMDLVDKASKDRHYITNCRCPNSYSGMVLLRGAAEKEGKVLKEWTITFKYSGTHSEDELRRIRWLLELAVKDGWKEVACSVAKREIASILNNRTQIELGLSVLAEDIWCL